MSMGMAIWGLARHVAPLKAIRLLLAFVLASLTEGIGILLLVPLLQFLQGGAAGQGGLARGFTAVFAALGLPMTVGGLLLLFAALVAVKSLVQYQRETQAAELQNTLVDDLRHECFAALLAAEWRWLAAGRKSDHANLLLTDVSRVGVGVQFAISLVASLVSMAVYLLAALFLSWKMTALALVTGIIGWLALRRQRQKALQLGQQLGQANRAIQSNVQEGLAGIRLSKILGNEARHLTIFRRVTGALRRQQISAVSSNSAARALAQSIWAVLLALYLYVGLALLATPIPELLTLVVVFGRLIPMFNASQQHHHHLLHALPALVEVNALLHQAQAVAEPQAAADAPALVLHEAIELRDLSVRYADRSAPALDHVSVRLPAHTTTAVIGPSGAGKSTLADVLMGLLQPDGGEVRVDGQPLVGEHRLLWRRSVAYVPQENFLFHDTIRANLLWGHPAASEMELHQALERAAADFVFCLPAGLETVVGDGGIRLSGGERQRLALARALLKRPALLILDEATSALDRDNEARVRRAIENLHGDMTVLIIGHRLATLEHADLVLQLRDGRLEAHGSWQDIESKTEVPHGPAA